MTEKARVLAIMERFPGCDCADCRALSAQWGEPHHQSVLDALTIEDGYTLEQIEAVIADGPVLSPRQQPMRPEYHIVTVPTLTLDDIQPQGPNPSMRDIIERCSKNGLSARERGKLGGRPRAAERCPCGAMTRTRAEQRRHYCTPE